MLYYNVSKFFKAFEVTKEQIIFYDHEIFTTFSIRKKIVIIKKKPSWAVNNSFLCWVNGEICSDFKTIFLQTFILLLSIVLYLS